MTRKICEPLEEDSFRPILHHYDGPKFRLELNIPEVIIIFLKRKKIEQEIVTRLLGPSKNVASSVSYPPNNATVSGGSDIHLTIFFETPSNRCN